MKRTTGTLILVAAALALSFLPAAAVPLVLDYTGFGWITQPTLTPQQFSAVGVVDGFTLPVYDPNQVYTYYLANLTLSSIVTHAPSRHTYIYSGGQFGFYQSTSAQDRGYDYGVNPANGTVPATFTDGLLWLGGTLNSFSIYFDDGQQLGSMSAAGNFASGAGFGALAGPGFSSFSGLTSRPGNGIPNGYKYRMDGQVDASVPVPEPASIALLGLGLLGAAVGLRVRRSR